MDYNKYYKSQLEIGKDYERYVSKTFWTPLFGSPLNFYDTKVDQYNIGESKEGVEIKFNSGIDEYGSLYFEIGENRPGAPTVTSGIYRADNTVYWICGDKKIVFLFLKDDLREIYEKKLYLKESQCGLGTSVGYLLTVNQCKKHSIIWTTLPTLDIHVNSGEIDNLYNKFRNGEKNNE